MKRIVLILLGLGFCCVVFASTLIGTIDSTGRKILLDSSSNTYRMVEIVETRQKIAEIRTCTLSSLSFRDVSLFYIGNKLDDKTYTAGGYYMLVFTVVNTGSTYLKLGGWGIFTDEWKTPYLTTDYGKKITTLNTNYATGYGRVMNDGSIKLEVGEGRTLASVFEVPYGERPKELTLIGWTSSGSNGDMQNIVL